MVVLMIEEVPDSRGSAFIAVLMAGVVTDS